MASYAPSAEAIRDRAAHWVARVNDNDLSDAEREDLQAWLLADSRHASEFRAHNALLALAREMPAQLRAGLDSYLPPATEKRRPTQRRWMWPAALAAAAVLAIVAGNWFKQPPQTQPGHVEKQVYATRTGENLTVTLEDGSVAHLNTRTRVEWIGGVNERRVRLIGAGEAFFDVVQDPFRPFIVELEDSEIVVLGTQFNVYRKVTGEVTVTVKEGKVAVRGRRSGGAEPRQRVVSAVQSVSFRVPDEAIHDAPTSVAASALKWREGLLVAEPQPLPEMISELNRYTDKPIIIVDDRLRGLYAGGVFSVRNVRTTLDRLASAAQAKVVETDGAFTLTHRDQ
jgi:transmembrane sensor